MEIDNAEKHTCSHADVNVRVITIKAFVGCYQSVCVTLELAEVQTAKSKQVIQSGITTERSLFNSLFNICLGFHEHISKTSTETLRR